MATVKDLRSSAHKVLLEYMRSLGFREGKRCSFFRVTEDGVIHYLSIVPIISGKQARVWVSCLVPEIIDGFDPDCFPQDGVPIVVGGMMSDKGIGNDYAKAKIDSAESREKFLESLKGPISQYAIPFFDEINTRAKFWDSLDDDDRVHYQQRGLKEKILMGA